VKRFLGCPEDFISRPNSKKSGVAKPPRESEAKKKLRAAVIRDYYQIRTYVL